MSTFKNKTLGMDPATTAYLEKIGHQGLKAALELHQAEAARAETNAKELAEIKAATDKYLASFTTPKAANPMRADCSEVCKCPEGPLLAPKPTARAREPLVATASGTKHANVCSCEEGPLLEEHVTDVAQIEPLVKAARARAELHASHVQRLETLGAKLRGIDEKTYRALADIPGLEIKAASLSLEDTKPAEDA